MTIELEIVDASCNGEFVADATVRDLDSGKRVRDTVRTAHPEDVDRFTSAVESTFGPEVAGNALRRITEEADKHPAHVERPAVVIGTDEHRVVDETIAALRSDPELFYRAGFLARVVSDEEKDDGILRPQGAPTIQTAPLPWLRERITRHARLKKPVRRKGKSAEENAHPPQWLTQAVAARGEWPRLRRLTAVSDSPVLRPDGSIHQTAGYDPKTGVLFIPTTDFPPIPPRLTRDHARSAAERLKGVVGDFKFEKNEHRSAWLASVLTPVARHAFTGPSPGFLVDANVRGAGKGLLCHTAGEIATGRSLPVCGYVHDAIEFGKCITAIAIAGDPVVLLDNLTGTFGNEALDRALTATRWKGRILGVSQNTDLLLLTTFYATGNNVAVAADTARRLIHVRLDVLKEKPEERGGFAHPDLLGWVRTNRPNLLVDVLTILAAYCRADRPDQRLTPFGSFEGWSGLVRSALVWCGELDPCETRKNLTEVADTALDTLRKLIAAWDLFDPARRGLVVSDLVARLYARENPPVGDDANAMRAAFEMLTGSGPRQSPTPSRIGNRLKSIRRRVINGVFLDIDPTHNHRGGSVWRVFEAKDAVDRRLRDSRDSAVYPHTKEEFDPKSVLS